MMDLRDNDLTPPSNIRAFWSEYKLPVLVGFLALLGGGAYFISNRKSKKNSLKK